MRQNHIHYGFLVFIGRFQPFHKGHEFVVKKGLEVSDKVIVLCGSAGQLRSLKNPWTIQERKHMIRGCFSDFDNKHLLISPVADVPDNDDLWVANIQQTVASLVQTHSSPLCKKTKISLIGHSKDSSSYYLRLFPQWDAVMVKNYHGISSTFIREKLFTNKPGLSAIHDLLPDNVNAFLQGFISTDAFVRLRAKKLNSESKRNIAMLSSNLP